MMANVALTGFMASADPMSGKRGGAEAAVRFDDMLATVLAQPLTNAAARAIAWRQVVDLLAQRRATGDDPIRDGAYDLLRSVREEVPLETRVQTARSLSGHRLPAELIAYFADEAPLIAAPVIAGARLADEEWLALLPTFSPTARGLLRNRRDLSPAVMRALASFGASDFVLCAPLPGAPPIETPAVQVEPAPAAETHEAPPASPAAASASPAAPVTPTEAKPLDGEIQIRDLMARIDAFRRAAQRDDAAEPEHVAAGESFRFETGTDGAILWVGDAPRGALIGITLAAAAEPLDYGVDGQVAGAFRQRAPFRNARLSVAGMGSAAGEWRISAVPFFDPEDGRFIGYRGTARRPRADETAMSAGDLAGLYGSGLPSDSLRQLVHELRTPLNAIVGFAEMIERQLLGPAAREYRGRAGEIVLQGRRLLATVDDLDVSARLESQRMALDPGPVDGALLLARLRPEYERIAGARGIAIDVTVADPVPTIDADPIAVERMFARLLAATVGLADRDERIGITLAPVGGGEEESGVGLTLTRPALTAGREEPDLLDPGYTPEGDFPDAPVLGLGFALRLVRNLATAARGRLDIGAEVFALRLPARRDYLLSSEG
jgi:signal transduction histidine kinase